MNKKELQYRCSMLTDLSYFLMDFALQEIPSAKGKKEVMRKALERWNHRITKFVDQSTQNEIKSICEKSDDVPADVLMIISSTQQLFTNQIRKDLVEHLEQQIGLAFERQYPEK